MEGQDEHKVELQDEQGNDVPFEHLMTLKHEGNDYVLLEAMEDMEDCMKGEAIILKITQDENGQDIYVTIDDEAELKAVFEKCVAAMDEEEEGGDEDDSPDAE